LPVSRLFESHIKVLELEHRLGSTPIVLIARSEDGKSFFAVERESRDLYAICKLGSWIKISQLCAAAVVSRHHLLKGRAGSVEEASSAKCAAEESIVTPESSKYNKKKRLAIEAIQSMVKRPSRDMAAAAQHIPVTEAVYDVDSKPAPQGQPDVAEAQDHALAQPSASDILQNIRSQYFEALYLSKVGHHPPILHTSC
jgi:hypothetical protein